MKNKRIVYVTNTKNNNKKIFIYLFYLFFTYSIISFHKISSFDHNSSHNAIMTIFVHGTVKPAEFSFSSVTKILTDRTDNTLYSRAIHYMRNDPFLYQGHAVQELGLKPIIMAEDAPHKTARTVAQIYDIQNNELQISHLPQLYYTFGWSGLLSQMKRYVAAEDLYYQLNKELKKLKNDLHITPFIRIISFSHGGNVVLNLSAVQNSDPFIKNNLIIDELISFSTPIQKETDHLITDPMFKKIYHLYSTEDNIQAFDMFSSEQFFSKRKFSRRSNFSLPEKLHQIRIRTIEKVKWKSKIQKINKPHEILTKKRVRLIHRDPKHTEMWSFKWGAYWYRNKFPLNPLPLMAFTPTIIHAIESSKMTEDHITFDIAPTEFGTLITYKEKNIKKDIPFLSKEISKKIWDITEKNTPEYYNVETQQEHVALALQKAKEDLSKIKKYHKPRHYSLAKYMKSLKTGKFDNNKDIKSRRITL